MTPEICLPRETVDAIRKTSDKDRHPGLELDKFCALPSDEHEWGKWQESQGRVLDRVAGLPGDAALLDALLKDRRRMLQALNARCWTGTTQGPLTLHLARAGALENAGICLHPLYGFVWIPGSGLKGMTRAFAETLTDATAEDRQRIFGWSPDGDDTGGAAGSVVFHEAWPTRWPSLVRDLSNSHHAKYYTGERSAPPADYEEPIPISFLSVQSKTEFEFALSRRSTATSDTDLALAQQWLIGALEHLGVGAKTAAGYGTVICDDQPRTPVSPGRRELLDVELKLVTPAFLAGAQQSAQDCDLRVPTLRGQLRWWWRTMHAGQVDVETLRMMEAAVWGDTDQGSPVRLTLEPTTKRPAAFNHVEIGKQVNLPAGREMTVRGNRITQMGLHYVSYGMAEIKGNRHYLPPGSCWRLSLTVRDQPRLTKKVNGREQEIRPTIPADLIRDQVEAALWLLTHFGGVGAKSRNGFGSFADIPALDAVLSLEECMIRGARLRKSFPASRQTPDRRVASLDHLQRIEIETHLDASNQSHVWFALDRLGYHMGVFADRYSRTGDPSSPQRKAALGLPRHGADQSFSKTYPRWAKPVHFHWGVTSDGKLKLYITAFLIRLPELDKNREMIEQLRESLAEHRNSLFRVPGNLGSVREVAPQSTLRPRPPMRGSAPPPRRDNHGNRGPRR
ncbi:MAG: hypothetical protein GEEBNDBF_02722 [bacterium]|nr:hypothetical protein [bacterium]